MSCVSIETNFVQTGDMFWIIFVFSTQTSSHNPIAMSFLRRQNKHVYFAICFVSQFIVDCCLVVYTGVFNVLWKIWDFTEIGNVPWELYRGHLLPFMLRPRFCFEWNINFNNTLRCDRFVIGHMAEDYSTIPLFYRP